MTRDMSWRSKTTTNRDGSLRDTPPVGPHIVDGQFKSDKYDWCPAGFVPLKLTDPMAQLVLWHYATLRRQVDEDFALDLQAALSAIGFDPEHPHTRVPMS